MTESLAQQPGLLAPEDLAQTLTTIQSVLSLYADADDVDLDEANETAVRHLAKFLTLPLVSLGDANSTALRDRLPAEISFGIKLHPWRGPGPSAHKARDAAKWAIVLEVQLSIRRVTRKDQEAKEAIRWPRCSLRPESFLDKDRYAILVQCARQAADKFEWATISRSTNSSDDSLAASYINDIAESVSERASTLFD